MVGASPYAALDALILIGAGLLAVVSWRVVGALTEAGVKDWVEFDDAGFTLNAFGREERVEFAEIGKILVSRRMYRSFLPGKIGEIRFRVCFSYDRPRIQIDGFERSSEIE